MNNNSNRIIGKPAKGDLLQPQHAFGHAKEFDPWTIDVTAVEAIPANTFAMITEYVVATKKYKIIRPIALAGGLERPSVGLLCIVETTVTTNGKGYIGVEPRKVKIKNQAVENISLGDPVGPLCAGTSEERGQAVKGGPYVAVALSADNLYVYVRPNAAY